MEVLSVDDGREYLVSLPSGEMVSASAMLSRVKVEAPPSTAAASAAASAASTDGLCSSGEEAGRCRGNGDRSEECGRWVR